MKSGERSGKTGEKWSDNKLQSLCLTVYSYTHTHSQREWTRREGAVEERKGRQSGMNCNVRTDKRQNYYCCMDREQAKWGKSNGERRERARIRGSVDVKFEAKGDGDNCRGQLMCEKEKEIVYHFHDLIPSGDQSR
jgi:hypothetical protein